MLISRLRRKFRPALLLQESQSYQRFREYILAILHYRKVNNSVRMRSAALCQFSNANGIWLIADQPPLRRVSVHQRHKPVGVISLHEMRQSDALRRLLDHFGIDPNAARVDVVHAPFPGRQLEFRKHGSPYKRGSVTQRAPF